MAPPATVHVTPRFEIFYALQALESGAGERLSDWRREMERRLPARARTEIARAAPSPLMWPLVADALRDEPADLGFPQIVSALRSMGRAEFQRAVLAGVFKSPGAVDGLMSGRVSLKRTISAEPESRRKLLMLLGLHPFDAESAATHAFERVVAQPIAYRDEIINVLEMFWQIGFSETWEKLEHQMTTLAREMKTAISRRGFAAFASERQLPIDTGSEASTLGIHVIPSAFNISRLWAAYADSHERTRFFVPVLDRTLLVATPRRDTDKPRPQRPEKLHKVDGALVFNALGDTTRYAIATTLARTPMTSVELARLFKVSKPTISHHVQLLRSADLLREQKAEHGTVLSINRSTLERASSAAAAEMFSDEGPDHIVKRSRKSRRSSK
jgi:ArsR family transcriptional regulator, arsenate/arsenite/antimonite-responsive transcriptional repressor